VTYWGAGCEVHRIFGRGGVGEENNVKRLRLAAIGCGGRTYTYLSLAAQTPDRYEIVAAADPQPGRVERIRSISNNPAFRAFRSDADILAADRLADIMVIGTQDSAHFEPCQQALKKGYDILLEKPIATRPEEVLELTRLAERLGRRVLVCHILRYTPFYRKIKEILASGIVGDIITLNAIESLGPWHQAHSYVRGHWAVTEKTSPMIIAKSCHDLDICSWLIGSPCKSVSSFGSLTYFTAKNAPAGAPARCADGCPVGDTCDFNAGLYATRERAWLSSVYDAEAGATPEQIQDWLRTSPWGRCVFRCDNTAVDHQVACMRFANDVTATFTMTAFDAGRCIEIYGTRGFLTGRTERQTEGTDILFIQHHTYQRTRWDIVPPAGGYAGHGGGDPGLIQALYEEMNKPDAAAMESSIQRSEESHMMGFAMEASRLTGKTIELADFVGQFSPVVK
jgi:predicted dehydrogenase